MKKNTLKDKGRGVSSGWGKMSIFIIKDQKKEEQQCSDRQYGHIDRVKRIMGLIVTQISRR